MTDLLLSLALIIILGFVLKGLFEKIGLPGLLGMLAAGFMLGPGLLNLLSAETLSIGGDLRKIALIVILVRAGLSLDLGDLKRVGLPAALMSFVPASFEIAGVVILGPLLLGISLLEAAVLGTILAAVSPAIVMPKMLKIQDTGYGRARHIPQMILASSSVDNIYAVVVFTLFMGLATGGGFNTLTLVKLPLSLISGLAAGILTGWLLTVLFRKIHMRDTVKVLLILGLGFLLVGLEASISRFVPFSGLLAVVAVAAAVNRIETQVSRRLAGKFSKVWVGAELIMFVLLGAIVDLRAIPQAGFGSVALILSALVLRSAGVWLSTLRAGLNNREKLFCILAYLPKASMQAVLGALPLAAGLAAGPAILAVAVLAVLITAPLGEIAMEHTFRRLLSR